MRKSISRRRLVLLASLATLAPALSANVLATSAQADPVTTDSFLCPADYTLGESEDGVTECSNDGWHLLAIDLTEGAKLRVVSDPVEGTGPGGDAQFNKMNASGWWNYIANYDGPIIPSPTKLKAVVNAGFFVNTGGGTTPLSLPHVYEGGQVLSTGYAGAHPEDAAWTVAPKFSLRLGNPSSLEEQVVDNGILGNPMTGAYDTFDVYSHFAGYHDGTVGFPYWTAPSEANASKSRTFVFRQTWNPDTGHSMVYILTKIEATLIPNSGATLAEMNAEIQHILNDSYPDWSIQFDGGASTQYCSFGVQLFDCEFGTSPFGRDVPQVFAVYGAPPS